MRTTTTIEPRAILDAFTQAKVLVSMSQGDPLHDSYGRKYKPLTTRLTPMSANQNGEELPDLAQRFFLEALVGHAVDVDPAHVELEFGHWPTVTIDGNTAIVETTLTITKRTIQ